MTVISDIRPDTCRFRLHDEGKAYHRSGCTACGRTITTGLGTRCAYGVPGQAVGIDLATKPDQQVEGIVQGAKLVAGVPPAWGRVVSMVEFRGTIYVATEQVVCRLVDDVLEPIKFKVPE